jgi:hypothetical protein
MKGQPSKSAEAWMKSLLLPKNSRKLWTCNTKREISTRLEIAGPTRSGSSRSKLAFIRETRRF